MRTALGLAALFAAAAALVSGGAGTHPRTPPALPGLPPPFLVVAVSGDGGRMAAVDAYGDLVGLWAPGPAGAPLVDNPTARQMAGTVAASTGVVARMRIGRRSIPFWRADSVRQRYLPGTNALRTVARFGDARAVVVRAPGGPAAARAERHWIARARPLGAGAPTWARRMYERSLLALRALTDRRTGAVAAGARDGWAYVWPRDAGAVAIALAASGYRGEARRVARFLLGLDLGAAARFHGDGTPVGGRGAQGDAAGWVVAAARAAGLRARPGPLDWQGRADYQEGKAGDYLANAIASTAVDGAKSRGSLNTSARRQVLGRFGTRDGLVREAGNPGSGLDSAAAWAVRPFSQPQLYPLVRRTLLRLATRSGRFGIVPSEDWDGGDDPWTAPTAWSAWGLAALAQWDRQRGATGVSERERHAALRLMAELHRAATTAGLLPERVDARTGIPTSTTPLAWSHAFAILAIRQLWPRTASNSRPTR